ncbi:MAG TPA: alkaline phosphatase [Idiomarina sp.]|uniref:YqaA family protein n=1 Tax=Idiomarina TaxID=135575 RepID=UPI0007983A09|nr:MULTISPECIES: VTT domain-containing protein [Idiomarina]KXS35129.1 MAG: putative conserved membrane protein [Idiomarina sp. T82-3]MBL73253.1 alkaline phosphatase [Idiomarinaceae bacterium]MBR37076.1 alkaline phosphatase [Idiomarina sp.]HAE90889.1 alkaline phosphatase [Idiomarina sp.]
MSNEPASAQKIEPDDKKANKWFQKLIDSPHALVLLFFFSALEATIIPIPLELILVPYMLVERQRIWLIASVALAGCLTGATAGYFVGQAFMDTAGVWAINYFGIEDSFEQFKSTLEAQGFWAVFLVGVTPVPFQTAMLAAGAVDYSFAMFMLASALSRGIRYYGLALLALWLGPYAQKWWQKHAVKLGWGVVLIAAMVIIGVQLV